MAVAPGGQLQQLTTRNGQDQLVEQRTVAYTTGGIFLNGRRTRETFRRGNPNTAKPCATADCVADYTLDGRERLTRERITRQADGTTVVSDTTYTAGRGRQRHRPNHRRGDHRLRLRFRAEAA